LVEGKVTGRFGDAEPRDDKAAAGPGHVVEAGAGVEVMTAAGAAANCGTPTMAPSGEYMAANADHQGRVHRDLHRVIRSGYVQVAAGSREKRRVGVTKVTKIPDLGTRGQNPPQLP
jgi:hypothetical protein